MYPCIENSGKIETIMKLIGYESKYIATCIANYMAMTMTGTSHGRMVTPKMNSRIMDKREQFSRALANLLRLLASSSFPSSALL